MKPLIPHLHLVDFCSWIIVSVVLVALPLPLLTSSSFNANSAIATCVIAATAAGCLAVILLRGRKARRQSERISRNLEAPTIPFDDAQIQDGVGRPFRDLSDGVVSLHQGRICFWDALSTADSEPTLVLAATEVVDVRGEYVIRFGCYPLLVLVLASSNVVRIRPIKPKGFGWRIGMNRREIQEFVDVITSATSSGD